MWPPDYTEVFRSRQETLLRVGTDYKKIKALKMYYALNPLNFIEDWCVTYDPRNMEQDMPKVLPFILFPKQKEFIDFLRDCVDNGHNGLVEKSRDMGVTWLCCVYSVYLFLFRPGSSVGWGSRKEQLVDRIGDPDSIFEKMRIILDYLPQWLLPAGYDKDKHASYMKLINPDTGSTITGEAGDNIGRGGRKTVYFKDESAQYERPELIEAALGDNTNCQIDISTVRGTNTVFYRRRVTGELWDKKKVSRLVLRGCLSLIGVITQPRHRNGTKQDEVKRSGKDYYTYLHRKLTGTLQRRLKASLYPQCGSELLLMPI